MDKNQEAEVRSKEFCTQYDVWNKNEFDDHPIFVEQC